MLSKGEIARIQEKENLNSRNVKRARQGKVHSKKYVFFSSHKKVYSRNGTKFMMGYVDHKFI
jgi:hypothetical protein